MNEDLKALKGMTAIQVQRYCDNTIADQYVAREIKIAEVSDYVGDSASRLLGVYDRIAGQHGSNVVRGFMDSLRGYRENPKAFSSRKVKKP